MAKKWESIKHKIDELPAEEREAIRERVQSQLAAELADYEQSLAEVRRARELTQEQLGKALAVSQAQVSRIENQTDLYLSTLASYVEAMGGELVLGASFGGGTVVPLTVGEPRRDRAAA